MKELESGEDSRPDWCPEGVWPEFRRACVAFKSRVDKSSMQQVADRFGFELTKVRGILSNGSWRLNMNEERDNLATGSALVAGAMMSSLHQDLSDEAKLAKMTIRDKSIVAKNMSDNMLNLTNGTV